MSYSWGVFKLEIGTDIPWPLNTMVSGLSTLSVNRASKDKPRSTVLDWFCLLIAEASACGCRRASWSLVSPGATLWIALSSAISDCCTAASSVMMGLTWPEALMGWKFANASIGSISASFSAASSWFFLISVATVEPNLIKLLIVVNASCMFALSTWWLNCMWVWARPMSAFIAACSILRPSLSFICSSFSAWVSRSWFSRKTLLSLSWSILSWPFSEVWLIDRSALAAIWAVAMLAFSTNCSWARSCESSICSIRSVLASTLSWPWRSISDIWLDRRASRSCVLRSLSFRAPSCWYFFSSETIFSAEYLTDLCFPL